MDEDFAEDIEISNVMGMEEVLAVLSGIIRGEELNSSAPESKAAWPTHGNILSAIDMYFKYAAKFLDGDEKPRGAETGGWYKDEQGLESRGV